MDEVYEGYPVYCDGCGWYGLSTEILPRYLHDAPGFCPQCGAVVMFEQVEEPEE